MKTFLVTKREVWTQIVKVSANSKEEAIEKTFRWQDTEYVDNTLEYSRDLDSSTWDAEEVKELENVSGES